MCGIYGEFLFSEKIKLSIEIERLDLLRHRGPDGFGFEYGVYAKKQYVLVKNEVQNRSGDPDGDSADYFLGHRRLSIVDLNEDAFQPMEDATERLTTVFNGEIYNYVELRQQLEKEGAVFRTDHSDTEVLLNAYAAWGSECLKRFRGMFSFIIYDRERQLIFMARDRIGKKPLYYEFSQERFAFASEVLPLLASTQKQWEIDEIALNCYIGLGYVLHPLSIIKGINKLPPACYGIIHLREKTLEIKRYWDLPSHESTAKPPQQFTQQVEDIIRESVAIRLRADVPVAAFISGGIDSTLVVQKMNEIGDQAYDLFGADFPQPERSEKKFIEEVSRRYSQNLNLSYIDSKHIEKIPDIVKVFDEPFDGASSIAIFDLFKEAAKKYKVILTGDGGDEMFAGYLRYITYRNRYRTINLLRKLCLPRLIVALFLFLGLMKGKARKLAAMLENDFVTYYLNSSFNEDLLELLRPDHKVDIKKNSIFLDLARQVNEKNYSPIKSLQYLEINTILPCRMLYKVDRFSMFYGVEARSPLLDHVLAEKAFEIPEYLHVRKKQAKAILKSIVARDFGPRFVHRKKQGFGNPLVDWFRMAEEETILGILLNRESEIYKYLSYTKFISYLKAKNYGEDENKEKELWRLLVLAYYLENVKEYISN